MLYANWGHLDNEPMYFDLIEEQHPEPFVLRRWTVVYEGVEGCSPFVFELRAESEFHKLDRKKNCSWDSPSECQKAHRQIEYGNYRRYRLYENGRPALGGQWHNDVEHAYDRVIHVVYDHVWNERNRQRHAVLDARRKLAESLRPRVVVKMREAA